LTLAISRDRSNSRRVIWQELRWNWQKVSGREVSGRADRVENITLAEL
jgi:hypothetical protein